MAHKIVIDLSPQSINNAIKWAEQEKKKILDTIHTFMQMLIDEGVTIAQSQVVNIDSGETLNSIKGMFKTDDKAVIIADSEHAVWLEFGTGVRKNPEPYPLDVAGIVPIGTYGKGNGSNPNGWYYPTNNVKYALQKDGKPVELKGGAYQYMGFTQGIKANKFMLFAKMHLEEVAPKWAMDIFSKI